MTVAIEVGAMETTALETGLVGHWPLRDDTADHSRHAHKTSAVDVVIADAPEGAGPAGRFNGKTSALEVADHPALRPGCGDFSAAAWVWTDGVNADVVGDLVSKYDVSARKGWQLSVATNAGMVSVTQANRRNLQFGVDNARVDSLWTDCGRPGRAQLVTALRPFRGRLYATTFENHDPQCAGRLFVYDGNRKWTDLGNPVGCNAAQTVTEFDGHLYCGFGRYVAGGSRLGDTRNMTPGGQIYRLNADGSWTFCGHPGAEDAVAEDVSTSSDFCSGRADDAIALTVYRGELYAVSNHRKNVFKYEGGTSWRNIGLDSRLMSFVIYKGDLYALCNGRLGMWRYEGGSEWTHCGVPPRTTQTYSGVIHQGELYVGTWPEGELCRYLGGEEWEVVCRCGYAREVMGMAMYNGKPYLGTLPMANAWRFDVDEGRCKFLGTLDQSSAELRRLWCMTVYQGKLYGGLLPSGHVKSLEAGKSATWDTTFPGGWRHVAAVREQGSLRLYVDGQLVSSQGWFAPEDYNLDTDAPLKIGFGPFERFDGWMRDVRLYSRPLGAGEIRRLAD